MNNELLIILISAIPFGLSVRFFAYYVGKRAGWRDGFMDGTKETVIRYQKHMRGEK